MAGDLGNGWGIADPDATDLPAPIRGTQQKMGAMKFVDIGHKLNCKVRNEK